MSLLHPMPAAAQAAAQGEPPAAGRGHKIEGIATMRHGVQAHA
jgi:hypothetical protein